MQLLVWGLGIGLLAIAPPGPVTVTVLNIAAQRGRRAAVHAGAGVALGDLVVIVAAVALLTAGAELPPFVFAAARALAVAMLIAFGIAMLVRPDTCATITERIDRPGRTLFLITSLTPSVLAAWLALFAAMPFAAQPVPLSTFALGVIAASIVWHLGLGAVAGELGPRAGSHARRRLAQLGGASTVLLGLLALVSLL